jgi:hypothetical protein
VPIWVIGTGAIVLPVIGTPAKGLLNEILISLLYCFIVGYTITKIISLCYHVIYDISTNVRFYLSYNLLNQLFLYEPQFN